jgi:hypothetical protein
VSCPLSSLRISRRKQSRRFSRAGESAASSKAQTCPGQTAPTYHRAKADRKEDPVRRVRCASYGASAVGTADHASRPTCTVSPVPKPSPRDVTGWLPSDLFSLRCWQACPADRLKHGNPPTAPSSATHDFPAKTRVSRPPHSDRLLTGGGRVGGGD